MYFKQVIWSFNRISCSVVRTTNWRMGLVSEAEEENAILGGKEDMEINTPYSGE